MTYRNDTETINDLRTELSSALTRLEMTNDRLDVARRRVGFASAISVVAVLCALGVVGLFIIAIAAMQPFAPMSAKAHARGQEFCDTLDKQDREKD